MMLRLFTLSTLFAVTTASSVIPASSRLGSSLLSKARLLNDNNNNNNDNGEVDYTWVSGYSIVFESCHTTLEFRADAGGSGDEVDGAPTESMRLVHFKLCPSDTCGSSCAHGADYLVEMREFVESYLEFQMTQQEYNCEQVKENCVCDDDAADEETCEQQCYQSAGLDYCEDNNNNNNNQNNNNNGNNNYNNNGEEFEIDQYLECNQINENNNGYSDALYVGAYCSDNGKSIYLGTFTDRQCTQHTSTAAYESYMGTALPYTSESIVGNDCISCLEPVEYDDDYNADQYDNDQVVEICEELYERSAKCERNLQGDQEYLSVGGCDYIFNTLPRMERLAQGKTTPAVALAWVFAATTLALGCYAAFLYKKMDGKKIDLSAQGV